MLVSALVFVICLVAMEFWAAFVHKKVYHGVLWSIHRSHHSARRDGRFERNDLFVVFNAAAAMVLVVAGLRTNTDAVTAAGLGMTMYGLLYMLVHDGYIHKRLPVGFLHRFAIMRRIRDDHLYHHTGDPGAHFGLFFWNRSYDGQQKKTADRRA